MTSAYYISLFWEVNIFLLLPLHSVFCYFWQQCQGHREEPVQFPVAPTVVTNLCTQSLCDDFLHIPESVLWYLVYLCTKTVNIERKLDLCCCWRDNDIISIFCMICCFNLTPKDVFCFQLRCDILLCTAGLSSIKITKLQYQKCKSLNCFAWIFCISCSCLVLRWCHRLGLLKFCWIRKSPVDHYLPAIRTSIPPLRGSSSSLSHLRLADATFALHRTTNCQTLPEPWGFPINYHMPANSLHHLVSELSNLV